MEGRVYPYLFLWECRNNKYIQRLYVPTCQTGTKSLSIYLNWNVRTACMLQVYKSSGVIGVAGGISVYSKGNAGLPCIVRESKLASERIALVNFFPYLIP